MWETLDGQQSIFELRLLVVTGIFIFSEITANMAVDGSGEAGTSIVCAHFMGGNRALVLAAVFLHPPGINRERGPSGSIPVSFLMGALCISDTCHCQCRGVSNTSPFSRECTKCPLPLSCVLLLLSTFLSFKYLKLPEL